MNLLYPVFTVVMFLTSFLCGLHAWGDRDQLVFYGSTIVYGLLLEKLVILYFQNYTYPAAQMLDFAGIPIAIVSAGVRSSTVVIQPREPLVSVVDTCRCSPVCTPSTSTSRWTRLRFAYRSGNGRRRARGSASH